MNGMRTVMVVAALSAALSAAGSETQVTERDGTVRTVAHNTGSRMPYVGTIGAGEALRVAEVAPAAADTVEGMAGAAIRADRRKCGGMTAVKSGGFELRAGNVAGDVRRLVVAEGVLRFCGAPSKAGKAGPELVPNPGFEQGGRSWRKYVRPGDVAYATQYSNPGFTYRTDSWAFGCAAYDGDCCLRAHNNGGAETAVKIPEAGTYRFTMHARPRSDTHTVNPMLVALRASDGTEIEIFRGAIPFSLCFVEYVHFVDVPAAGDYSLVITGLGIPNGSKDAEGRIRADLSVIVDGVSLVRAERAPVPDAPAFGGDIAVTVAEGAKLALDSTAANEATSLRLGREYVTGTVSAATHPKFIEGPGSIRVLPKAPYRILINKEDK